MVDTVEDGEDCGEPDLPIQETEEEPPCEDCDKPGKLHPVDFNPKLLLDRLCAGGKCPKFDDRVAVANGDVVVPPKAPFKRGGFMAANSGS